MKARGMLAREARRIAAAHGVSLRQAYRYAAAGREPSDCVRVGVDSRRYHVHLTAGPLDYVKARRVRYEVAGLERRFQKHGFIDTDLAELETAQRCLQELVDRLRSVVAASEAAGP